MEPLIIVHGGAGPVSDSKKPFKIAGCKAAVKAGHDVLMDGGDLLDVVEAAIHIMEDDEYFNAGYGSVLNLEGEVEMDASIMLGKNLRAGAVSIVKDVKYPITLARRVMEKTPHVLLAGVGANKFAKEQGLVIDTPGTLVTELAKKTLEKYKRDGKSVTETTGQHGSISSEVDTVGCVVMDSLGNLCAGTSTGGLSGKMAGRVSDSSQIGSGTYADNDYGAVSTTGHGEAISRFVLAHAIVREIESGKSAQEATETAIEKMKNKLHKDAGAITISRGGDVGIAFSSKRMAWAYIKGNELHYGVDHDEHEIDYISK